MHTSIDQQGLKLHKTSLKVFRDQGHTDRNSEKCTVRLQYKKNFKLKEGNVDRVTSVGGGDESYRKKTRIKSILGHIALFLYWVYR